MYQIDEEKLNMRPEMRLGDRIYAVDNRLSTFRKISQMLNVDEGTCEFEVVMGEALGAEAYDEIVKMDLPFSVMQEIVVIILAAIQDLPLEEARRRYQSTTR